MESLILMCGFVFLGIAYVVLLHSHYRLSKAYKKLTNWCANSVARERELYRENHKLRMKAITPIKTKTPVSGTTLQKYVARAIIELAPFTTNGIISTADVAEKINRGKPDRYKLSPDVIGRALSFLGLTAKKISSNARGWIITQEDLDRLRKIA